MSSYDRRCRISRKNIWERYPKLKGKSNKSKSKPISDERIEFPEDLEMQSKEVELYIYMLFIDKSIFRVSIDLTLKFRVALPLKDRETDEIYKGLYVILRHYNDEGFKITRIHCDKEFKSIMDEFTDCLDIKMLYASNKDHVLDIELSNRTVEERYRVAFYSLKSNRIPKLLTEHLTM